MKEKELRLALVCYGGVSLAVYMHGVTKEVLKLVRASRVLHNVRDRTRRRTTSYAAETRGEDRERDTEEIYFDLLREIGRTIDLRVLVDVIAGASAGGINGVMLARAIAHDLPQDRLRTLWLDRADVTDLLAADRRARAWSKWMLRPLIWLAVKKPLARLVPDQEMQEKLSLFLRSRWFRPPFDGMRMLDSMYRGLEEMGEPASDDASLMPTGHRLDLLVTATDFHGYLQRLPLHDPTEVFEREHRYLFRFRYRRHSDGTVKTDFDTEGLPGLAFAARATSSFPGAFPPASLHELDRYLRDRGITWFSRHRFVSRAFARHREAGIDPNRAAFIDGSVLINKPFGEAIRAIVGRPAAREVDRRLVYIDPHPSSPQGERRPEPPGFFSMLRGSLSDIPRNEPIRDEIAWVNEFNQRVGRLKSILESVRPTIVDHVREIIGDGIERGPTYRDIANWRDLANTRAAEEAGFAYQGYVRLKILTVADALRRLLIETASIGATSPGVAWIEREMNAWLMQQGIVGPEVAAGSSAPGAEPPWVRFLLTFDVGFRVRRLRFVVRALNQLYARLGDPLMAGATTEMLDELKRALYSVIDRLRRYTTPDFLSRDTTDRIVSLFTEANERHFVGAGDLAGTLDAIAAEIDLDGVNEATDEIFGTMVLNYMGPGARHELFTAYIGFPFWDVMAFSVSQWQDLGEFDEIRIDRISPDDARMLRAGGTAATLKGIGFAHFAAFFNRRYRENDYLWGRLHAAERLIDIAHDAAGRPEIDTARLKRRAFAAILAAETPHLLHIQDLIAELKHDVEVMPASPRAE